jgi:hypothetical protein
MNEIAVPDRLSNESSHHDFRPDFTRVGVRVDGVERNDIIWYDQRLGRYRTTSDAHDKDAVRFGTVEPYWRHAESRQQRRARERWEAGRAK